MKQFAIYVENKQGDLVEIIAPEKDSEFYKSLETAYDNREILKPPDKNK